MAYKIYIVQISLPEVTLWSIPAKWGENQKGQKHIQEIVVTNKFAGSANFQMTSPDSSCSIHGPQKEMARRKVEMAGNLTHNIILRPEKNLKIK